MPSEAPARLVQLTHPDEGRRVALVDGAKLRLLSTYRSVYGFAKVALEMGWRLRDLLSTDLSGIVLDYDELHQLKSPWRFRASFDHDEEPARCLVSAAGTSPDEWTYLGLGATLRGHGDPIWSPHAGRLSLGDLAAAYLIAPDGAPRRVGITPGTYFSGATRNNVIGPELILDPELASVEGLAALYRDGARIWEQKYSSQGAPLLYGLAALEPDHFRFADHHRAWDAHVHFIGARLFPEQVSAPLNEADQSEVVWEGLGRPLNNLLQPERREERRLVATAL